MKIRLKMHFFVEQEPNIGFFSYICISDGLGRCRSRRTVLTKSIFFELSFSIKERVWIMGIAFFLKNFICNRLIAN